MKYFLNNIYRLSFFCFLIAYTPAMAHQPRITESVVTSVTDPEISKAYYAQLPGIPQTYIIEATGAFDLYVNILVPDIGEKNTNVVALIFKNGDYNNPVAVLGGLGTQWKSFFEPFGRDSYLQGPEYRQKVSSGTYEVRVSSPYNNSKYSLAIGEIENFDFQEIMNALSLVPKLKRDFFGESPIGFILSLFGWGIILIEFILACILGILLRIVLKKIFGQSSYMKVKNIGTFDRLLRGVLSIVLLLVAITTSWSLILIFISGFCLFEALFTWCPFYMAIGKNTCPIGR